MMPVARVDVKSVVDKQEEVTRAKAEKIIECVAARKGELLWQCVGGISCMFVDLDTVYVGCGDGHIYAIDATTGAVSG